MTPEQTDRLEKALRDYDMELLGCYDVHPDAYENDVEAPEHRRAFVDHMLKLAHPDLIDALATKDAEIARLREAALALRNAQRAYLADRGNETLGRAVGAAAKVLDRALEDTP